MNIHAWWIRELGHARVCVCVYRVLDNSDITVDAKILGRSIWEKMEIGRCERMHFFLAKIDQSRLVFRSLTTLIIHVFIRYTASRSHATYMWKSLSDFVSFSTPKNSIYFFFPRKRCSGRENLQSSGKNIRISILISYSSSSEKRFQKCTGGVQTYI